MLQSPGLRLLDPAPPLLNNPLDQFKCQATTIKTTRCAALSNQLDSCTGCTGCTGCLFDELERFFHSSAATLFTDRDGYFRVFLVSRAISESTFNLESADGPVTWHHSFRLVSVSMALSLSMAFSLSLGLPLCL